MKRLFTKIWAGYRETTKNARKDQVLWQTWLEGARLSGSGARGLWEGSYLAKVAFSKGLNQPEAASQGGSWRNQCHGLTLSSLWSSAGAPLWLDPTRRKTAREVVNVSPQFSLLGKKAKGSKGWKVGRNG